MWIKIGAAATFTTFLCVTQVGSVAAEATFAGLGDLPGNPFDSQASDVSSDGSVVVGLGRSMSGREAFQWTEPGVIEGLSPSASSEGSRPSM